LHQAGTYPTSSNATQVIRQSGTIPSGTTNEFIGVLSAPATQAASFTLPTLRHFHANPQAFGAGSTVTDQYGFVAESTLTGATNNYGFLSAIASGTNRWNFYASGTAKNYFGGQVLVTAGSVSAPAIAASSDTDTGMYFGAANECAIAAGGLTRVIFGTGDNRTLVRGNNEQYGLGVHYGGAGGSVYFGATSNSLTPDAAISNAGGGTLMTLQNGGNVGIGTTSPQTRLHCSTSSDGAQAIFSGAQSANEQTILFRNPYFTNNTTAGLAAIGWIDTGSSGGILTFKTTTNGGGVSGQPSEKMRIANNGNVTIGEANSANTRLMVAGGSSNISSARATYEGTLQINESSLTTLASIGGIEFKASVFGSGYGVKILGADDGALIFGNRANSATWSESMRITQNREMLIGTTSDNGAYLLQVNSQIYATNATIATSDARFKTNVESLTDATSVIESLRPVAFDFIPQADRNFATERQVGLIAQETQAALAGTDYADSVVAQCGDHLGLAYEKLVPVLIKALQESNARIAALEERING
jgi:hypothetical protein